jgi:hypothetical protein
MLTPQDRETKLPAWARKLIGDLRFELVMQRRRNKELAAAHGVLFDREWFTIPGTPVQEPDDPRTLFLLERNRANSVCTLYNGDVLLIGRRKVEEAG